MKYRGRFAPSPTGRLHFGSLVAATASWLDARSLRGEWLLRMEDLDLPRNVPGAADAILQTLDECGLHWDGPVLWQNQRTEIYAEALERLRRQGAAFPCACSRRDLPDGVYPGTCRGGIPAGREARAWRVRVPDESIGFTDRLQGRLEQNLQREIGDFVVKRADGIFSYQLAVVVDDSAQNITHVVRGADLLDSTPRQILLQRLLGCPPLHYLHLPVAVNASGEKLSKQTLAPPAGAGDLPRVLEFLGHSPPGSLAAAPPGELLAWAREHWMPSKLPTAPSRVP
jgi:glutamyl-Q tRNA(Asp) synthetase